MRKLTLWLAIVCIAAACAGDRVTQTEVPLTGTPPPETTPEPAPMPAGRRSHSMILLRPGQLLVTGGQTIVGNSAAWLGDSWIYNTVGGGWERSGDFAVRGQHAVAASARDTLLFGGYAGTDFVYRDLQTLVSANWIDIVDSSRPSGRTGAVMAYDAESDLFIMFGGDESPFDARLGLGETWTFSPVSGQWQELTPPDSPRHQSEGHPTLFELAMVYHEGADRMLLMIGGDELWAYDADENTWEQRAAPGLQADFMIAAAYSEELDRLITYGGAPTETSQETWTYHYATDTWERIETATSPGPLVDHAMAYDPATKLIYMFGGAAEVLSQGEPEPPSAVMWVFDGFDWKREV